jgi:hypothetical protein
MAATNQDRLREASSLRVHSVEAITIHEFTRNNTKGNPHEKGFVLVCVISCNFVDRSFRSVNASESLFLILFVSAA